MIIYYGIIFIYYSLDFVSGNNLFVNIEYGDNQTFIFYYNLTTNYSYYLTFRLFEHEPIKFGLISSNIRENRFQIPNQYDSPTTLVYLFIICFHFIRRLDDMDIQCKDIRLSKSDLHNKSHLPSYKPLFVPMMYALNFLMLLPVIIQHRRRKHAAFIKRRRELRRLSLSITEDNPGILSKIVERGALTWNDIPMVELVSSPTIRTTLNDVDDNDTMIYKRRKSRVYFDKYTEEKDDEEAGITADDSIAHLLNSRPWNSSESTNRVFINSDPMNMFQDQYIPMARAFYDTKPDDRQSPDDTDHFFRSNPAFIESDV